MGLKISMVPLVMSSAVYGMLFRLANGFNSMSGVVILIEGYRFWLFISSI